MLILLLVALSLSFACALVWFWTTQPFTVTSGRPGDAPRADPARLAAHVRRLAGDLSPRDAGHADNLARAAAYIRAEMERARGRVSEQQYEVMGKTYTNVIATFGAETSERIVVGAHYDAAGALPGADDNASGVAGLVELGQMLGAANLPLRVDLVAYSLEEPPFFRTRHMGSALHAQTLRRQGADVRLMFSLEMIGYFSDEPGSQQFPVSFLGLFYPTRGNFISVVGNFSNGLSVRRVKRAMRSAAPLPVFSINAPRSIPGIDFSDHLNYWENGYDAVMITDTAFYRNGNYHTASDTPETLDYRRMALVVEGIYAAVLDLAR